MPTFNELVMAVGFVGAFVICPLTFMFLMHQRAMMQLIHNKPANETIQRLEFLERKVQELEATRHERLLTADDQQELHRRTS